VIDSLEVLSAKSNELMATLGKLGWQTDSLSSAISIYKNAVLEKNYVPTVYDLPDSPEVDGLIKYCYRMMCREWRTVYRVGLFENATDYDLRSSYPSVIKDFPNTDDCKIQYSKKLIASHIGVCNGIVHINKDYHPIVSEDGKNRVGSYPDVITTEQWSYLVHYGVGSFEMEDGYFITFADLEDKPFYDMMQNLYAMRESGGLHKTLAKSTSVGLYGYLSQEYPEKYGDYFHPLYSILTTSRCALKVGKFIENNLLQQDLVSVTVDGLVATKNIPLPDMNDIGEWRKERVNALILSIGHQYVSDKKDRLQNTYATMIAAIKEHPNRGMYNDVLLNRGLMNTNRVFKKFPSKGNDILENVYTSEPVGESK
jgi:hypothetical protein